MLAIRRARESTDKAVQRVMIIDTDVHQGNGHERDKLRGAEDDICIVDVYNAGVTLKQECVSVQAQACASAHDL